MQRREFLQTAAGLPFLGRQPSTKSCILLLLTGGPSHLDTWDPKPDAPTQYRSPFRPIRTNVPGIQISELFPRMARHADKYALIRSVHHNDAAIHETGLQLIQPHIPSTIVLPWRLGNMGTHLATNQTHARIAPGHPANFTENCQQAVRLIESGTRFVTVNQYDTVFHKPTWDAHGTRPFSTLADYPNHAAPAFDLGFTTLLEELSQRGLLESTLVVAAGEFGRSPKINPAGGRDHWPQCWTILMAGAGIQGGQIHGASDATGSEPRDNPIHASQIAATIIRTLAGDNIFDNPLSAALSI